MERMEKIWQSLWKKNKNKKKKENQFVDEEYNEEKENIWEPLKEPSKEIEIERVIVDSTGRSWIIQYFYNAFSKLRLIAQLS